MTRSRRFSDVRATLYLCCLGIFVSTSCLATSSGTLDLFSGNWIATTSMGDHITVTQIGNTYEISLSFGQAVMTEAHDYGANYKISGDSFECYYFVTVLKDRMTWQLKNGSTQCLPTSTFERVPPPPPTETVETLKQINDALKTVHHSFKLSDDADFAQAKHRFEYSISEVISGIFDGEESKVQLLGNLQATRRVLARGNKVIGVQLTAEYSENHTTTAASDVARPLEQRFQSFLKSVSYIDKTTESLPYGIYLQGIPWYSLDRGDVWVEDPTTHRKYLDVEPNSDGKDFVGMECDLRVRMERRIVAIKGGFYGVYQTRERRQDPEHLKSCDVKAGSLEQEVIFIAVAGFEG